MAVLVNGDGFEPVTAQMDADFYAGIFGGELSVVEVGSNMAASIQSATAVRIADGEAIIQGRRIHIDAGSYDEFTIPVGEQGVTKYYVIGYELYRNEQNKELCRTFVQEVSGSSATVSAGGALRDGASSIKAAMYRVTKNGVNIEEVTALFESPKAVRHNQGMVYRSLADLGIPSGPTYWTGIVSRMSDNSVAFLPSSVLHESHLPYSEATGMLVIIKGDSANGKMLFLSGYGNPNYEMSKLDGQWAHGWKQLPTEADAYYQENERVVLWFCASGYITTGGTEIYMSAPLNRRLRPGRNFSLVGGNVVVRQGGQYIAGSPGGGQELINDMTIQTQLYTYENEIFVALKKPSGWGGTNNDCCGVSGHAILYES